jgi:hypothetical protein
MGGASPFGFGTCAAGNSVAAVGYGSGGAPGTSAVGGAGKSGIIIVQEYY